MLTFPEVLTHKGVTVYPDDSDPSMYYLLPDKPQLRVVDDKPVFRGLFWTDTLDGTAETFAGLKGAKLNFDVNLAVDEDVKQEIQRLIEGSGIRERRKTLQENAERERLQRLERARGNEDWENVPVDVPAIGGVRFGAVQWLDGKVTLLEEESGGFVEWSSAGGPPALFGDNNSAFALRLGPEGAAVWYRALEGDAAAIGVRYELTFQARLPSLEIHVWAGSHQREDLTRRIHRSKESMDQGCSDVDVAHTDNTEIAATLVEEGLINIEIKKGTSRISDDHVSQLRQMAIDLIGDRVKEVIRSRVQGMTPVEWRNALDGELSHEITSFAELRFKQQDVIEWKANPQATITEFLGGLTGSERDGLVTLVDLRDPVVETLEVEVTCSAEWEGDPKISRVVVSVHYAGAMAGDEKTKELTFDKDAEGQTLRWRRPDGDGGVVRWSADVWIQGFEDPVELPGGRTNSQVHVEVPALGKFEVVARPHADLFLGKNAAKISSVELAYQYKNEGDPDHVSGSVVVSADHLEDGRSIVEWTGRRIDAPVTVTPKYHRLERAPIDGEPLNLWFTAGRPEQYDVPSPWKDWLRLRASVPAGIDGLREVLVSVEHHDPDNEFQTEGRILLGGEDAEPDDWAASTALARIDPDNSRYRWRYAVVGEQQIHHSTWQDAEGEGELILSPLSVSVRGDLLKLGEDFLAAQVELTYVDEARGLVVNAEFVLEPDAARADWLVPRLDPTLDTYTWKATLIGPTGQPVQVGPKPGEGKLLFLTPPE